MTTTANEYGSGVFEQHQQMLIASGITPEHARARGYVDGLRTYPRP